MNVANRNIKASFEESVPLSPRSEELIAVINIIRILLEDYPEPIAIRVWNGELIVGDRTCACCIAIHAVEVVTDILLKRDLFSLGEHYLAQRLTVEGDLEKVFDLGEWLAAHVFTLREKCQLAKYTLRLSTWRKSIASLGGQKKKEKRSNSISSISHHYDIGNAFYKTWLDKEMVYSCGYFERERQSLNDAQQAKLDYICRKLRLSPDLRMLDVGCGWGALACWAATHYGVYVDGITLSQQQYEYASERVQRANLQGQVNIRLLDYRDIAGEGIYDRIVSVGMFEHIGLDNFPMYFSTMHGLLKSDGLFLNHGISNFDGWGPNAVREFVNHYIFPDGELTRVSGVCTAMEQAGFEIQDLEAWRRHYTLTLRHWLANLQAHGDQAIKESSTRTFLLWKLYLAGCAHYFDKGEIGVNQILATRRFGNNPLPLSRSFLYARRPRYLL